MILNDPFPMILIMWPIYWLLLVPTVLIEYGIVRNYFGTRISRVFWPTAVANIISSLIGIPIAWGLLTIIEFVLLPEFFEPIANILSYHKLILNITIGAPWIAPYAKVLFWTIPLAAMFLLIPFYFVSVWIEGFVLKKVFKISTDTALVKRACWKANLASYVLLFLFCLGILFWSFYEYTYK